MKKSNSCYKEYKYRTLFVLFLVWLFPCSSIQASDLDIYSVNAKQNCYVLMDNSGSMNFGVYEHTIDYGDMFDYLFTLNDVTQYYDYIYDTINNSDYFYQNHKERRKIFLWKGAIGATIATIDGESVAFSGDAANPDYLWYMNDLVDTHTLIDDDGNLTDDGTGLRRITVDAEGHILFDGQRLPLSLDLLEHDYSTLYDGSIVDNGFAGLLNAPGYYFSGYEGVSPLNVVESGDTNVYFFVTGNWVNMQAMYNLHYTTNNPDPTGASTGDMAWRYEHFPLSYSGTSSWSQIDYALDYPEGSVNYTNKLKETDTAQTIVSAGVAQMKVHFSSFDVEGDGSGSTYKYDFVAIYDASNNLIAQYDNDNKPTSSNGGWSAAIPGDTAKITLKSDTNVTGGGYTIDKIQVVYGTDDDTGEATYLMQSRLDVAKDAMIYVVDEFRGKMNWGYATYDNGDGAKLYQVLNPNEQDDTVRAAIVNHIDNVVATGGTPLMEALQDVWQVGYNDKVNSLDNLLCRKNYIISMTDGYPSLDTDGSRIDYVSAFNDADGDGWTSDPYQPPVSPNYYDDVGHWLYTHSWMDGTEVADPADSYVNVMTHHIAFGSRHPLLEDAAGESGGEYIVAYNKQQLVAAFYSLAKMMANAVSFTAPVVSNDDKNKIRSGNDLYMGLFLAEDSNYWVGNIKKYQFGDGSTDRPLVDMIYDAANNEAIDSDGTFLDNTAAFWGDDTDANDNDAYGGSDIQEDGVGEVLLERVQADLLAGTYWERPIYTYKNGVMTKFDRDNITAADLGVADDTTRDALINFVYGYTYDADAATGAPLGTREWVLGAIIHSQPITIDYYDTSSSTLPLLKRLIAVGSNDGMLHFFDDTDGSEVFAFIPSDILEKLQYVQANDIYETVDGSLTLYRKDRNPKYLIFGERRGGGYFWNLNISDINDPLNWTVQWSYTNAEIQQSWSEVALSRIPVGITSNGERTFKDVAIFTGGYDTEEDYFPEPYNDLDNNGTPFKDNGAIDTAEWDKNDGDQDYYPDNLYTIYNPEMNEYGRGVFVVDIDDPTAETWVDTQQVLPFSVTYGATDVTSGNTQTLASMQYCFPASPKTVRRTEQWYYLDGGNITAGYKTNVLEALYAIDVYANLYKMVFDFETENTGTDTSPSWSVTEVGWSVNSVFNANPGSDSSSGTMGGAADTSDQGRKAFYPPEVSWGGTADFFEAGNFSYEDVTFNNTDKIASLFFGTGDREHPRNTFIRNRFYAVYDDSLVTAEETSGGSSYQVSSAPYEESNLLNLTCDELGEDSIINSCYLGTLGGLCDPLTASEDMKTYLKSLMTDDAVYGSPEMMEYGASNENDAKGWYIVLEEQGSSSYCSHMTYSTTLDTTDTSSDDNHLGEKILSEPVLFYGILYFTSYQPAIDDPCSPKGNGFAYSIKYTTGSAYYDFDATGSYDIADRYKKTTNIAGLPSQFSLSFKDSGVYAYANVGDSVEGGGADDDDDDDFDNSGGDFEIANPGLGLQIYYWRDSNSQR